MHRLAASLLALALALVALAPAGSASAAQTVVKTKVTAHVVELKATQGTTCNEGVFVEVPTIAGYDSYEVGVADALSSNGRPTMWIAVKTAAVVPAYPNAVQLTTAFVDDRYETFPATSAGRHRFLLLSRDCRGTQPVIHGRFRITSAAVLTRSCTAGRAAGLRAPIAAIALGLPRPGSSSCSVADTVLVSGSARSTQGGRTGVHVQARDERGRVVAADVTGRRYELSLRAGSRYELSSPDRLSGRRWCARGPSCTATVEVSDTHRGVVHRRTVDFVLAPASP